MAEHVVRHIVPAQPQRRDAITEIRAVAEELRNALALHDLAAMETAEAEEALTRRRLAVRAAFLLDNPKMRLPDLEMHQELDERVQELRADFVAKDAGRRAVKERLHTMRQLLSSFQSTGRIEADLSR